MKVKELVTIMEEEISNPDNYIINVEKIEIDFEYCEENWNKFHYTIDRMLRYVDNEFNKSDYRTWPEEEEEIERVIDELLKEFEKDQMIWVNHYLDNDEINSKVEEVERIKNEFLDLEIGEID